jgi:hypothetical protein
MHRSAETVNRTFVHVPCVPLPVTLESQLALIRACRLSRFSRLDAQRMGECSLIQTIWLAKLQLFDVIFPLVPTKNVPGKHVRAYAGACKVQST